MSERDPGYFIVDNDDLTKLREEVNQMIPRGWFVHLGLVIVQMPNRLRYFQVMVKKHAVIQR